MNSTETNAETTLWPLLGRWRLCDAHGSVWWHLARLNSDGKYWGYVHFRTDIERINRSFSGVLDRATLHRIEKLIAVIVNSSSGTTDQRVLDGLIGIGSRGNFRRYFGIRNGVAETNNANAVVAYHEILEIIVPIIGRELDQTNA